MSLWVPAPPGLRRPISIKQQANGMSHLEHWADFLFIAELELTIVYSPVEKKHCIFIISLHSFTCQEQESSMWLGAAQVFL